MIENPSSPGPVFLSNDEAQKWAIDLVTGVKEARARCDLEKTVVLQKKWHQKLLVRYGAAKGALDTLYRCGRMDANMYETLADQALAAFVVRVVDLPKKRG